MDSKNEIERYQAIKKSIRFMEEKFNERDAVYKKHMNESMDNIKALQFDLAAAYAKINSLQEDNRQMRKQVVSQKDAINSLVPRSEMDHAILCSAKEAKKYVDDSVDILEQNSSILMRLEMSDKLNCDHIAALQNDSASLMEQQKSSQDMINDLDSLCQEICSEQELQDHCIKNNLSFIKDLDERMQEASKEYKNTSTSNSVRIDRVIKSMNQLFKEQQAALMQDLQSRVEAEKCLLKSIQDLEKKMNEKPKGSNEPVADFISQVKYNAKEIARISELMERK